MHLDRKVAQRVNVQVNIFLILFLLLERHRVVIGGVLVGFTMAKSLQNQVDFVSSSLKLFLPKLQTGLLLFELSLFFGDEEN